jgi:hypothetical protein
VAGALILTAEIAAADLAWLDALRCAHYPPERNRVRAHLTMFHALPPSAKSEVRRRLAMLASAPPPKAQIAGLMNLGGGVAYRIASPDLDRIRDALAQDLHGLLGAQDACGWQPHVTIQNKVAPKIARSLIAALESGIAPRPLAISGLGLHRYMGGSWEEVAIHPLRG